MYIDENSKPKEKLKAWYLFTEDFIAGTQHLTNEQIGIYIRLLCWNWNKRCCGIPNDKDIYYRIGNCITDKERVSCETIIKEFFVEVQGIYQNERQLQEFLYITKRIEASKVNGKLGGRPKKPSQNPPTTTTTTTSISKKENLFDTFWEKIKNKVGKGTAFKNYMKIEEEWYFKPLDLAIMYNKYYDSIEDKKFAKHPAFWLSDKRYLDETPSQNNDKIDEYSFYSDKFLEVIKDKKPNIAISKIAQTRIHFVKQAINENKFTKEEAIKFLDMAMWL